MRTSLTSSFWLNVFYYCQIVPAPQSFFVCLKRNIRFFICSALIADKIFLFGFSASITCSAVHAKLFCENDLSTTYTQFNESMVVGVLGSGPVCTVHPASHGLWTQGDRCHSDLVGISSLSGEGLGAPSDFLEVFLFSTFSPDQGC